MTENGLQIRDIREKGIHIRVGNETTAADFQGGRDPVDNVIRKFQRGLNNIPEFLSIAAYQPYFAVCAIHHAFYCIEDYSRPAVTE